MLGEVLGGISMVITDLIVPFIGWVLFFLQLSMLMDIWDPCDLDEQIDSRTLLILTNTYNKVFREIVMKNYKSVSDPDGNSFFVGDFPLEYYGNNLLLQLTLNSQKCEFYKKLTSQFISSYVLSLSVNSDGYYIDWESADAVSSLTQVVPDINDPNWRKNFWNRFDAHTGVIANNNTVVQNWLHRNWPYLLIFFILVLIIIFVIIKKRNVKNNRSINNKFTYA